MKPATVIEAIAAWCSEPPVFSPLAMQRVEQGFLDTVGCMVAGRHDAATLAVANAFAMRGRSGTATVVSGGRIDPATAALINGTAAHALDFDDNFHGATTHASAVLVPALLATAQDRGREGRALLEAYIIGLEAQAWIGRGVNPSHYTAGWHSTSTVGCIGAAAAVAWLMGLDRPRIAAAVSIAVSMAAGVKVQFGTPVKPLHAGLAARNAIEAASLAAAGLSGRLDVLESSQGFLSLYGGDRPTGWSQTETEGGLGEQAVERFGLTTKRHPCCGATHRAIDAVLDLRSSHGFTARDVAAIRVTVTEAHARNLAYQRPENEMQARFSMPYALALALLQDSLRLSDFTGAAVQRPDVRALLPLTELATYDQAQERAATGRLPHRILVKLRDGRQIEEIRQVAKSDASMPLSTKEQAEKFLDCARFGRLAGDRATALFHQCSDLRAMSSAGIRAIDFAAG